MAIGIRNPAEYQVAAFRGATDLDSALREANRVHDQLKMMKDADGCPFHWTTPLDDVIGQVRTAIDSMNSAKTRLVQLSKTGS